MPVSPINLHLNAISFNFELHLKALYLAVVKNDTAKTQTYT